MYCSTAACPYALGAPDSIPAETTTKVRTTAHLACLEVPVMFLAIVQTGSVATHDRPG
jgi:hypothetical protein